MGEKLSQLWLEKKPLMILIIILIFFMITGLIFFIVSLNQKPKKPPILNPNVTLNWWKVDYNSDNYQNIIEQFKQIPGNQNVNINVVSKRIDNSYYRDLISDLARKIGPDIITLQNNDLPAYKEFLSPINNIKGASLTDYRNDFVNLAVRDTMDKDKVFCVTSYVDNLQLYYNSDLLTQSQYSRPAETWEALVQQVQNLRQIPVRGESFKQSPIALGTGGRSTESGGPNIEAHQDIIPALIFQFDGQIYDYQNQKSVLGQVPGGGNQTGGEFTLENGSSEKNQLNINSNSFKALEFYNSFANSNDSRYSWNKNNPKSTDMFAQGRLVYNLQYKSFAEEIKRKNPRLNFEVSPIPQRNNNQKRTFGKFNMDCLNSSLALKAQNTTDLDAVAKYQKSQDFLTYLTQKENQTELAFKSKLPSAHKDAITQQLKGDKTTKTFADGALYSDNYYLPDVERTQNIWTQIFENVQYNNQSLESATQKAINEYTLITNGRPQLRK